MTDQARGDEGFAVAAAPLPAREPAGSATAARMPAPAVAYWTAVAAAMLAFVAAFLPWYRVGVAFFGVGYLSGGAGTDAPMLGGWTLALALLVGVALVLLALRPDPRLWSALPVGGVLIALLALISAQRVTSVVAAFGALAGGGNQVGTGVGLWLTLVAGVALVVAGAVGLLSGRRRT